MTSMYYLLHMMCIYTVFQLLSWHVNKYRVDGSYISILVWWLWVFFLFFLLHSLRVDGFFFVSYIFQFHSRPDNQGVLPVPSTKPAPAAADPHARPDSEFSSEVQAEANANFKELYKFKLPVGGVG